MVSGGAVVCTAACQKVGPGSNPACGLSGWSLRAFSPGTFFFFLTPTVQKHAH